jgi:predicted tellurium resistance membrane protein TerC
MLIVTHVVIALSSIVSSAVLLFRPSKRNFNITYALVALTLGTGTVLVIETHSSLTHSCIAGLVYLFVVLAGIIPAHYRLESKKTKK